MTIGLLNPTLLLRRPIVELAALLEQRGHQVTIITPSNQASTWTPSHFQRRQVSYRYLPSVEFRRLLWSWPSWSAIVQLWRAVGEFEILQIWAPYYLVAILPIMFSWFHRRPAKIILTFDTIPGFSFRFDSAIDGLMVAYHRLVGSWLFRLVAARTLYSQQLVPYAKRAWLGKKFVIIPTGVDLQPPSYRSRHPSQTAQLLFVGLLNARKGVGVLLQAAALVQRRGVAFELFLVGDGPARAEMEKLTRDLGLSNRVHFVGRTSRVAEFLERSDMLILPSFGEGLPGVVMEAMASGVPVVASDIPCLTELIPDAAGGLLVPVGQPDRLATAILKYLDDEAYRRSVIHTARQQIEKFSWEKVVPRYEQLYAQVV